ncbi:biliverdin-producing heme oxygenase [Luteibacter aegosomaticola]|uniref:biliverdin-producing heme oxygenase n=1 Tax=Luteibacter aegosomaticola TaxID=2911538 RepID=UPI001FF724F9|nr:biliverdin-producing heme oxygenase [Luteibacter aegosomaticola]UPG91423.1 biliverdin-producing heme oxygenase [Luteibacter aegosomaticola]
MDGTAAQPLAHSLLRERTRAAHDAAEATAGMRALMSGAMDEAGYVELLAAQLRLFHAWEAERAADIEAVAAVWPYASRIPPLAADIVGAHPVGDIFRDNAAGPVMSPRKMSPTGWAPTAVDAAFWGELYVIEGSTLGGQVIVRHLRERFPHLPHAFYALGEHAPGRWRRFQQVLDEALATDAHQQLAIAGAQRMFARFQRTLQDPGHHV